jgi:hypothetical protein
MLQESRAISKGLVAGFAGLALGAALLAGCGSPPGTSAKLAPQEQAAAEATAILQSAEATAIVLRAQATAAALLDSAGGSHQARPPAATATTLRKPTGFTPGPTETQQPARQAGDVKETEEAEEAEGATIELLSVDFAADGNLISVQFVAPPSVARRWNQGTVSVTDEGTGTAYNEVPVMPAIGPLIGHPKEAGQRGYVMLVNTAPGLRPGSLVTVVLGEFKQEHVRVGSTTP